MQHRQRGEREPREPLPLPCCSSAGALPGRFGHPDLSPPAVGVGLLWLQDCPVHLENLAWFQVWQLRQPQPLMSPIRGAALPWCCSSRCTAASWCGCGLWQPPRRAARRRPRAFALARRARRCHGGEGGAAVNLRAVRRWGLACEDGPSG